MTSWLKSVNLPKIRTWFSTKAFTLVAISVLLCTGIVGCGGSTTPGTAPGAFSLSWPENGSTIFSLTPTFEWKDADGETSYILEIDDEDTFSSPLVYQNTEIAADTTYFVDPDAVLVSGTTYYWRVIASNSHGSTTASNAPFSFTVLNSGELAPGFGADGVVTSNPSTGIDDANAIAIDSTAMYVVGSDYSPGYINSQWRIEKRSLADGNLVPEFGADGVITSNPSEGSDQAVDITIDSTAMYVVGIDSSPGNSQWRIEKRSLADGSLITEFGTDGVVTSNPSLSFDVALDIAIDSTAMYVVGIDSSPGNSQWRIEKRSLEDGSLVSGFGSFGVVKSNPSTGWDEVLDIAIDSTAMYVVGSDSIPGNFQWRIEKRSLVDGSLILGFGTSGVVTVNPSSGDDSAYAIAIDSSAMYVVGWDRNTGSGNSQWQIEKRSLADGSLISEFGEGGFVTSNPSTSDDYAHAIAIDSTAIYVVGSDVGFGNQQWRIEKRAK